MSKLASLTLVVLVTCWSHAPVAAAGPPPDPPSRRANAATIAAEGGKTLWNLFVTAAALYGMQLSVDATSHVVHNWASAPHNDIWGYFGTTCGVGLSTCMAIATGTSARKFKNHASSLARGITTLIKTPRRGPWMVRAEDRPRAARSHPGRGERTQ